MRIPAARICPGARSRAAQDKPAKAERKPLPIHVEAEKHELGRKSCSACGGCALHVADELVEEILRPQYNSSCALTDNELTRLFGRTTPSLDAIQNCGEFWDGLERGQARHIVIHGPSGPSHIFFAGYSFD